MLENQQQNTSDSSAPVPQRADSVLLAIAVLMALFSLLPVYSASSNLAFANGIGSPLSMLLKHAVLVAAGLGLMYFIQLKISYRYIGGLSKVLIPISIALLIYTLMNGININEARRWISLPYTSITFQTSAFAFMVLIIFLARNLALCEPEKKVDFKASLRYFVVPIVLVVAFILPANFSTAALIFGTAMVLLYVGGYPLRNILKLGGLGMVLLLIAIGYFLLFPQSENRLSVWKQRIESFKEGNKEDNYQVHKAKMAIAVGGIMGKGPGKSVQKNFLPQSNSDFIYAIIIEEFGLIGGIAVPLFYLLFFIRVLVISTRAQTKFGSLLSFGLGLMIMVQAFVNMGVAVNIFPVTGQTLPLISSGGTSVLVTASAVGIILSVSRTAYSKSEVENEEPQDVEFAESINITAGETT